MKRQPPGLVSQALAELVTRDKRHRLNEQKQGAKHIGRRAEALELRPCGETIRTLVYPTLRKVAIFSRNIWYSKFSAWGGGGPKNRYLQTAGKEREGGDGNELTKTGSRGTKINLTCLKLSRNQKIKHI